MTVREKQLILSLLGFDPGAIDGIEGENTQRAMTAFLAGSPEKEEESALITALNSWKPGKTKSFWEEITDFRREEFRCPCGECGGFPQEPKEKLVRLEQRVRTHFGKPIFNSSGVRCVRHNRAVGGVSNSRHLTGTAVDFRVNGQRADKTLDYVKQQPETAYCYKIDDYFIHMDVIL